MVGAAFALLTDKAQRAGLDVLGILPLHQGDGFASGFRSLALLGPDGPRFWAQFQTSPEAQEDLANPVDRWSVRVLDGIAQSLGGQAVYPFGHTPPLPFVTWALRSGQCFVSAAHLLVHSRAGLWVSFRGAIAMTEPAPATPTLQSPCQTCVDKPCLSACPVGALDALGYDVASCHAYLDSVSGQPCMTLGCAARRACPLSKSYGRAPQQSEHHMKYFHP